MPFVLLFLAIVILSVGVRGHASDAGQLLAKEFTGPNSFIQWFLAIMILGLIGYYKPARPVADAMLGLVILAIILSKGSPSKNANGGFFKQLEDAFQNTKATPPKTVTTSQTPGVASPYASQAPFSPGNPNPYNPNMFDPTAPNFVGAY